MNTSLSLSMESFFSIVKKRENQSWSVYLTCFFFLMLMILFLSINTVQFTHNNGIVLFHSYSNSLPNTRPDCGNRYIYIHRVPEKFNVDVVKDCCKSLGLGPQITSHRGPSWFATNQFVLEVIFHNRIKKYECLTDNSSLASLVYVPYYAGIDVGRYMFGYNTTVRDKLSLDFVKWVAERPQWKTLFGHDHFLVVGNVGWDLSRQNTDWGNQFLLLPQTKNMSILIIEAVHDNSSEIAVPYPSYFHPSHETEVFSWQDKVSSLKRPFLFSFVGGPRPSQNSSIRGHIIRQCTAAKEKCKFLNCHKVACENLINVMETMESSRFCLQPPGDSATRRSTFDSILAGCIPVFFNQASAYTQYKWYLPDNYTTYSVFIREDHIREGKVNIEEVLSRIPEQQVVAMREEVVRLIPKISYSVSKLESIEDAFDIAINRLLDKVNSARELVEIVNHME